MPAPTPLLFWARRQAHETAIHRADAQTARGQITPFNSEFARDGIEELLFGFAARPRPAITPGTMLLKPDDLAVSWLVSFGDHGVSASVAEAATDATVVGHASDIYLWLWNRPSVAEVRGDHAVAARWRDVRVRWS